MKYKIILFGAVFSLLYSIPTLGDNLFPEDSNESDIYTEEEFIENNSEIPENSETLNNSKAHQPDLLDDSILYEDNLDSSFQEESLLQWFQKQIDLGFNQAREKTTKLLQDIYNTIDSNDFSFQALAQQTSFLSLFTPNRMAHREEIIDSLEEDMNVFIAVDDPAILNSYLLSYLYNYFNYVLTEGELSSGRIRIRTPYYLHARNRNRHPMVEVQGENIYIYKNASESIATRKFHETLDSVRETDTRGASEIQITFEYNNELYHQLNQALLSSEDIKDFVYRNFGIVFGFNPKDPRSILTQEYTREELLLILKQLLDIPVHIRDNMNLTRIVREPQHPFALGSYSSFEQVIRIYDLTHGESTENFERVVLHEIGHTLWGYRFWNALPLKARSSYQDLFWGESSYFHNTEFISEYSTSNVLEDFAEHFEEYIQNPERLRITSPKKYEWLKENVFINTEYFSSSAMDHLQIFVESDLEDIAPPHFSNNAFIHVSVKPIDNKTKLQVKVEINGLFDDVSGVKGITLKFVKPLLSTSDRDIMFIDSARLFEDMYEENECEENVKKCTLFDSNEPGKYVLFELLIASNYLPGTYELEKITVTDFSLNSTSYYSLNEEEFPQIFIPGTQPTEKSKEKEKEEDSILVDNIHWVHQTAKTGDTLGYLMVPTIELDRNKFNVVLKGEDTRKQLDYYLDINNLEGIHKDFESFSGFPVPQEPGFYTLPIVIPAELPAEKYNLHEIRYNSPTHETHVLCMNTGFNLFSKTKSCPGITHTPAQSDQEQYTLQPVVEGIQLSTLNQTENSIGGNTSITVNIPIRGLVNEESYFRFKLKTPLGQTLSSTQKSIKSDEGGGIVEVQFDLPPYHAEGYYFLSHISLHTDLDHNIGSLFNGFYRIYGANLSFSRNFSERMIRKTVTIQIPSFEEGQPHSFH